MFIELPLDVQASQAPSVVRQILARSEIVVEDSKVKKIAKMLNLLKAGFAWRRHAS